MQLAELSVNRNNRASHSKSHYHPFTMSSAVEGEIVRLVLEGFQRELRGLRSDWFWKMLMGEGPSEGFARQWSELDDKSHFTGSVRDVWRITPGEITELPSSFVIPPPGRINRRFFERAQFDFVIAPDCTIVVVGSQVGPTFGSGERYHVVVDDAKKVSFGLRELLWRS